MTLRFEGVRFSDGSCAVRRVAADPCDRATLTFESVRELEEDVGSADVSWIVDRGAASTKPPSTTAPTERPPSPVCARCGRGIALGSYPDRNGDRCCSKACATNIGELATEAEAAADADPDLRTVRAIASRIATIAGDPPRPVDGETVIVRTAEEWRRRYPHSLPPSELTDIEPLTVIALSEPDHYEPTEEVDEP